MPAPPTYVRVSYISGGCQTVPDLHRRIHQCYSGYNLLNEDQANYGFGWTPPSENVTDREAFPEYAYRTAKELNGYPYIAKFAVYGGGGYVAELKGSKRDVKRHLASLKDGLWLDRRTRAVFVEFTVYNPNVNLFGILTFVVEFTKSSYVGKSYRVESMNLLPAPSGGNLVILAAHVAYALFLVSFIVKEIRKMVRHRLAYFGDIWNYNELAIILLSIGSFVVYFHRLRLTKAKTKLFRETHGDAYMKFQYIAGWNELLLYTVGWLCFLATIKFLRLLRYNKKMGLLGSVLHASGKSMAGYMMMFTVWLMAFCQAFYLTYVESERNFSTIIVTLETLLLMLVGKIDRFQELTGPSRDLGLSLFLCYIVIVCYITFEMFMAILGAAIDEVSADDALRSNDFEVIGYMYQSFMEWTGLAGMVRRPKDDSGIGADGSTLGKGRRQPMDKLMESLSEKVDRLMGIITAELNTGTFETAF